MNTEMISGNSIAQCLVDVTGRTPWRRAVVIPWKTDTHGRMSYVHWTFHELSRHCDRYAWGLTSLGVGRGTRVLLMVRPSLEFYALTFAIFKVGAVPVLIDPGMGWRGFLRCVRQAAPEAFIGVPLAHILRLFRPGSFRSVRVKVTLGSRWFWGGQSLKQLADRDEPFPVTPVAADDLAAILFTTGSTGPAKGVQYTHRIFRTQVDILRREYGIGPGDIDLPCFPLFGLFSTALGATAVIPDMDPSRPAHVDPRGIVVPILDQGVTYSFGSPTLWDGVSQYCEQRRIGLPSLTRVIMAGAPVPGRVHRCLLGSVLAEGGETYTPYGATEALPVANFQGSEMVRDTEEAYRNGRGICVGRPLDGLTCRIIRVVDGVIRRWYDELVVPDGEIGEIVVKGPVVTRQYDALDGATKLAKIREEDGSIWHRMGDLGYIDGKGRLWFCGRKSHRVRTADGPMYTVRCEAVFNEHPDVYRSALVGVGNDTSARIPVIVIEPEQGRFPNSKHAELEFARQIIGVARRHELTRSIDKVLFYRSLPVDIRHNAKIRREVLTEWACRKLR